MKEETYKIRVACLNCGYRNESEKEKGTPLFDESKICPNCGCKELKEYKSD